MTKSPCSWGGQEERVCVALSHHGEKRAAGSCAVPLCSGRRV